MIAPIPAFILLSTFLNPRLAPFLQARNLKKFRIGILYSLSRNMETWLHHHPAHEGADFRRRFVRRSCCHVRPPPPSSASYRCNQPAFRLCIVLASGPPPQNKCSNRRWIFTRNFRVLMQPSNPSHAPELCPGFKHEIYIGLCWGNKDHRFSFLILNNCLFHKGCWSYSILAVKWGIHKV